MILSQIIVANFGGFKSALGKHLVLQAQAET